MKPHLIAIHSDPMILRQIVRLVASRFTTSVGRAAGDIVACLQNGTPHAVLVDPGVDGAGGLALLENIRHTHPAARRLLLTPAERLGPIIQGLHSGAVQTILYQPLHAGELLAALCQIPKAVERFAGDQEARQVPNGSNSN